MLKHESVRFNMLAPELDLKLAISVVQQVSISDCDSAAQILELSCTPGSPCDFSELVWNWFGS